MITVWTLWTWLVLTVSCVVGFFIAIPLAIVTFPFDRNRAVMGRFAHLIAVVVSKANPLWSFAVHGELPAGYRPTKTVVVSNHVSNSDAFLITHLPWEMKWLAKSTLFYLPFLGWLMWLGGDVAVKRGTRGSARSAMAQCARYLERGMPVVIFPEGTRSRTDELLDFKDGAFRLAIETGAELLPIAVAGTRSALPKHSWRFGRSCGRVTLGRPIETKSMTLDDLDDLKAQARGQIETLKKQLDAVVDS